jgi:hypothetical protein
MALATRVSVIVLFSLAARVTWAGDILELASISGGLCNLKDTVPVKLSTEDIFKVSVILSPAPSMKEDLALLWVILNEGCPDSGCEGAAVVLADTEVLDRPDQRLASSLVLRAKK